MLFESVSFAGNYGTLRPRQAGPNLLGLLSASMGRPAPDSLLTLVVARLSVDAGALTVGTLASIALVPVQLLDVRLLLFVGAHDRVVAADRVLIVIPLFLLFLDQSWREEALRDGVSTFHRSDRRDKSLIDLLRLRRVLVERGLVRCNAFVVDRVWLLPSGRRRVRVIKPVRIARLVELGALSGPLERIQLRLEGRLLRDEQLSYWLRRCH